MKTNGKILRESSKVLERNNRLNGDDMKEKILIILLGSFLAFQNCAPPTVKMTAVTESDQKIHNDGAVTSEKKHAVTISHYKKISKAKSNTLFLIVVENRGEKPLFINDENVSVIFKGNIRNWTSKKIDIQSLREFMTDLSDDYYYEEARIISGIISKANAAEIGCPPPTEQDVFRVVDRVKTLREELPQLLNVIPELILKPQLIKPHKSIMGIVACDTGEMPEELEGQFEIALSIDGEKHEFTFSRVLI